MLTLKLTLVPFFLFVISLAGKRWGPGIAGWLAGLPVIAGPILFLLVLIHGPNFGVHAATLSLSAILASEAFNFAYAWSCRSLRWPVALCLGLASWLVAAGGLAMMPASPGWAIAVAAIAVAFGQTFLPRSNAQVAGGRLTWTDLAGRMAAGAALTFFVTTLSAEIGPGWSGILAVFPMLGSILSVSSHRSHGPDFVISMLRGMVLGRFSFAAFCLCLIFSLPRQGTAAAFIEAAALAILVQWATRRLALAQRARSVDALAALPSPD
jgi:hypothetical protein